MAGSAPEKLPAAMWPRPRDSSIHADLTVDAGAIVAIRQAARDAGLRVTVNAIIAKVVGRMLVEHPEMNVDLRGGRLRQRSAIDVWVTMADREGHLAGRRVSELDERDLLDIQNEITSAGRAHDEGDNTGSSLLGILGRGLPLFMLRPLLRVLEFLVHTLRIPIPVFGLGREGFGAVHITNVGPFGIRHVAAPIPPITGQSFLLSVGEIYDAPVVRDGEVEAGPVLPLTATIDHRTVVGLRGGEWARTFKRLLTDVDELLGLFDEETAEKLRPGLEETETGKPAGTPGGQWSL